MKAKENITEKKETTSPRVLLKVVGGFTLIELMIVIVIISLLVSIFLVGIKHYRDNARDAGIKTLLLEIRNVAELYRDDSQTFVGVCDQGIPPVPPDGTLSNIGNFGLIEASINNNGGIVACQNSSSAFAVLSTLNNGNCWCIDSVSSSKEIESCSGILLDTSCP